MASVSFPVVYDRRKKSRCLCIVLQRLSYEHTPSGCFGFFSRPCLRRKAHLPNTNRLLLYLLFTLNCTACTAGPTNSGKTYQAIERLKKAGTSGNRQPGDGPAGLFCGPLRLLALEVYEQVTQPALVVFSLSLLLLVVFLLPLLLLLLVWWSSVCFRAFL